MASYVRMSCYVGYLQVLFSVSSVNVWESSSFNMSLTMDHTHDIYLWFARPDFQIHISVMEGLIDVEQKGYKSMGCCPCFISLNFYFTHVLDLEFLRSNFENAISHEWVLSWHGMKGIYIDRMLDPLYDLFHWPHPWPWPCIFKVKIWYYLISGMEKSNLFETFAGLNKETYVKYVNCSLRKFI